MYSTIPIDSQFTEQNTLVFDPVRRERVLIFLKSKKRGLVFQSGLILFTGCFGVSKHVPVVGIYTEKLGAPKDASDRERGNKFQKSCSSQSVERPNSYFR